MLEAAEANWGSGTVLSWFIQGLADDPHTQEATGRFECFAASPGGARQLLEMSFQFDIRSVLSSISAPTLVVHRSGDDVVPVECGRYTADHIDNASLVELPGDFHLSARHGDEDDAMDAIEHFLTGTRTDYDIDRVLTTVMFTDIVASTERAAALGDRAWRDLLDRHDRAVRREIDRFRGREIKTLGDGFLAAFDGPGRAVRCAQAITDEAAGSVSRCVAVSTPENARFGVQTSPASLYTSVPELAASPTREVLVSTTVKDLVGVIIGAPGPARESTAPSVLDHFMARRNGRRVLVLRTSLAASDSAQLWNDSCCRPGDR